MVVTQVGRSTCRCILGSRIRASVARGEQQVGPRLPHRGLAQAVVGFVVEGGGLLVPVPAGPLAHVGSLSEAIEVTGDRSAIGTSVRLQAEPDRALSAG